MKTTAKICLLSAAGLLSACGSAVVSDQTPYYFGLSPGDSYTFTANVSETAAGVIDNSVDVDILINGERHDMSGSGMGTWTYNHTQAGSAGFEATYELTYDIQYALAFPLGRHRRTPNAGSFQIPVLGAGGFHVGEASGDMDRDGVLDRHDNCAFHVNPEQENGNPGTNSIGDACDAVTALRYLQFEAYESDDQFIFRARNTQGGNLMLEDGDYQVYAFRWTTAAEAKVTLQTGFASLAGIDFDSQEFTIGLTNCFLMHQDPDGGAGSPSRFVQIFADSFDPSPDCLFRIALDGETLLQGVDPLLAVVTNNSGSQSSNAAWGRAKVFGRVTLVEPGAAQEPVSGVSPQDLFTELTEGSPTHYVRFYMNNYDPVADNPAPPDDFNATGEFSGIGYVTIHSPGG